MAPQGVFAEAGHEIAVRRKFCLAQPGGQWLRTRTYDNRIIKAAGPTLIGLGKTELRLPCANQLDVNFGKYFRIEQGAVLCSP